MQVPSLYYEDIFNMVAMCKDDKGALVQYPLLPHKGHQNLCYSPAAGVVVESSIPAKIATTISKRPASQMQTLAKEVRDKESEAEDEDDEEEKEKDGDQEGKEKDGDDGKGKNDGAEEEGDDKEADVQDRKEKDEDEEGKRTRVVGKRPAANMQVLPTTQHAWTQHQPQ